MENQTSVAEKDRSMYQRFATAFSLFFWGLLLIIIDLEVTTTIYFAVPGIEINSLDIFPDFIGALLVLIGSIYFVTQQSAFRGIFKFLILILPITAFVLFIDSIITLVSFNSEVPIWNDFAGWMEILLYIGFIGLGWKIASTYVPSTKKRWVAIIGFAGAFVAIAIALLIADQVIDLGTVRINFTDPSIITEKEAALLAFAIFILVLMISFVIYFLSTILHTREELLKKIPKN